MQSQKDIAPSIQQESFLNDLLKSDHEDEDIASSKDFAMGEIPQQLSILKLMQKSKSQRVESPYKMMKEELVQKHKDQIRKMREYEIMQFKQYLKDEDPETCINILYVLSQCKNYDGSAS